MSYFRLRQIALVARDLEPVEKQLCAILGADVCYRDPGVGKYGLHNALWALGGTFLEVVAPIEANTAGGRYLDRRKGDGGYMYILDCDDLEARREHFKSMDVRMVQDLHSGDDALWSEAIHLHPRDTGGCLLSIDRHSGGEDMMGGYKWAGPDWTSKVKPDVAISGAAMQCEDPAATSELWGRILRRPVLARADGGYEIRFDNALALFTPLADDRGEGLSQVMLACADPGAILAGAKAAGVRSGADWVEVCGVRFELSGQ
ncbi:MAG: VOC family protein [Hyphomonadaceae bacterium]